MIGVGDLVEQRVGLPSGELRLLQPREAAELPDDGPVEWAPLVPYWAVLWRSGVALARALGERSLAGLRVVELGCGMGVPSLTAARGGAAVLATDQDAEAVELLGRNSSRNGASIGVARIDWADPGELLSAGPFDLVLAADVLYERAAVSQLTELLPKLAPRALVADPGRPAANAFLTEARRRWRVSSSATGVVDVHDVHPT